jgi:hypothetical protein
LNAISAVGGGSYSSSGQGNNANVHGLRKHYPSSGAEISTARDLFRTVLPFVTCDYSPIREAVVEALGHVNRNVFTQLLDDLQPFVRIVLEDPNSNITAARRDVMNGKCNINE